jgi:adenylylsulfate kinase
MSFNDVAPIKNNLVPPQLAVNRKSREAKNGHKAYVIWFTGLSGSGKSTLANKVEKILYEKNYKTYVLDGDNVRDGLCSDLGFSETDRHENIRRIGEVSKLFVDAGVIVLAAFISPFFNDRLTVRNTLSKNDFIEVYCDSTLDTCEKRDIKGLYKKARLGEISNFTGITSPYEAPLNPDVYLNTGKETIENCLQIIINYIENQQVDKNENS